MSINLVPTVLQATTPDFEIARKGFSIQSIVFASCAVTVEYLFVWTGSKYSLLSYFEAHRNIYGCLIRVYHEYLNYSHGLFMGCPGLASALTPPQIPEKLQVEFKS